MHEYSKRIGEHIKSCYSDFNKMNREELDELKAWACVMKDLTEYDINKRGIEAMDEAEQEEKFYGRMGYRGRAANGRFVHRSGRGRSAGYSPYIPYLHMMEDEDSYDFDGMYDDMPSPMKYRMGYPRQYEMGRNSDMNSVPRQVSNDWHERRGYEPQMQQTSKYGESYDRYKRSRRHYTETKDSESKKEMDASMKEYMDDVMDNMKEIWNDADPTLRQTMKADLTKMVQQLQ